MEQGRSACKALMSIAPCLSKLAPTRSKSGLTRSPMDPGRKQALTEAN
jgi:hypothetical protein